MEAEKATVAAAAAQLPPLIGVEEACKLLGISRYSGYRAAREGELPTLRLGRRVFVPTAKLLGMVGLPVRDVG